MKPTEDRLGVMSVEGMDIERDERLELNQETARIPWRDLQRFFAQGKVVWVQDGLDLVEVALSIAHDDARTIDSEVAKGRIARVADRQARDWFETQCQSLGGGRQTLDIGSGGGMRIWVDADACPNVIKDILFRAAERVGVLVTLVANQPLTPPPSRLIRAIQVAPGFDVADKEIVKRLEPGDLVITADIPLAAEVIAQEAHALDPRGQIYTKDNIRERLNMRDFMDTLRSSGVDTGGPATLSARDRQTFANALDRFLARQGSHPATGS